MARVCVFCGAAGQTAEDVIPQWMREEIAKISPPRAPYGGPTVIPTAKYFKPLPEIVVMAPCATCNSGWMSDIENNAKGLIIPLMWDQRAELDTEAQLGIATWCYLKGLLLDLAATPRKSWSSQLLGDARDFYRDHARPKMASSVWLGRYNLLDSWPDLVVKAGVKTIQIASRPSGVFAAMSACWFLFISCRWFGDMRREMGSTAFGAPDRSLITTWPVESPHVSWPPTATFSYSDLRNLTE